MQVQAVAWEGEDSDDQFVIRIYGRSEDALSVCVTLPFDPYFFIKLRPQHDFNDFKLVLSQTLNGKETQERNVNFTSVKSKSTQPIKDIQEIKAKDLWGFRNEIRERFVKVTFSTLKAMRICSSILLQGP